MNKKYQDQNLEPESVEPEAEFVDEEDSENPTLALKKLREKLRVCQTERQEYLETSQRLKADHINYRREQEAGRQEVIKYAKTDLLIQLLELADSFELAMADKSAWEAISPNWRQGVEYIYAKLKDIFRQNGLEVIDQVDIEFDPTIHEAVGTRSATGAGHLEVDNGANIVLDIVQKGYRLNGKVIRPAKVKVDGHD